MSRSIDLVIDAASYLQTLEPSDTVMFVCSSVDDIRKRMTILTALLEKSGRRVFQPTARLLLGIEHGPDIYFVTLETLEIASRGTSLRDVLLDVSDEELANAPDQVLHNIVPSIVRNTYRSAAPRFMSRMEGFRRNQESTE